MVKIVVKKLLLILVVSFLVAACSSIGPQGDRLGSVKYDISYSHYAYNSKRVPYTAEGQLSLIFPAIPGLIFGRPTENILSIVDVQSSKEFTLELPSFLDQEADYLREPQLKISPKDAKILRLGTFHIYPHYQGEVGGGGFIDTESGNALILVYFSKPSKLTGTLVSSGKNYHHDIKISTAGWHWVEVNTIHPQEYVLKKYAKSEKTIDFMVFVDDVGTSI